MTNTNYIPASHKCVDELIDTFGLKGKLITDLNFHINNEDFFTLTTTEYVSLQQLEETIKILRKYKVTEIPQEEG